MTGRRLLLGGDELAEDRARGVGVEEIRGARVAGPQRGAGAPIKAVVPLPATDAPKWPPPLPGWTNVMSSQCCGLANGLYRYAAPAPALSCGEPIRMFDPTDATAEPKPADVPALGIAASGGRGGPGVPSKR